MNIQLIVSYVGTRYHGFQVQKNAVTVCSVLQDAIEKIYEKRLPIIGSSRTDSGVHAEGYSVNFFPTKDIPVFRLPVAINQYLPPDVRVISATEVEQDFHARYSAIAKRYVYRICNNPVQEPFSRAYTARYPEKLDEERMNAAAQCLVGKQDFRSFCAKSPEGIPSDTVRRIYAASVWREGEFVNFAITGDGFLYKMVRIISGTLIDIGAGRTPADAMPDIIAAKERVKAGPTAKSKGLTLSRVFYDEEDIF